MNPNISSSTPNGRQGAAIVGGGKGEGPGPRLMTADTLDGNKVVNGKDDTLGEIEHIMLDVQQGRIAYAVMSCGGMLGMGEKLFAIPWSALTLDTDRKCFVLDADEKTFKNAPGFDKDRWPEQADARWHEQVHQHFRATPYWA